jgi:hypothetical protein
MFFVMLEMIYAVDGQIIFLFLGIAWQYFECFCFGKSAKMINRVSDNTERLISALLLKVELTTSSCKKNSRCFL